MHVTSDALGTESSKDLKFAMIDLTIGIVVLISHGYREWYRRILKSLLIGLNNVLYPAVLMP